MDIVVAFSGKVTIPANVDTFVRRLVESISAYGVDDPWTTIKQVVVDNQGVLRTNNVVIAYRQGDAIIAREIALHVQNQPFGLTITRCGGDKCPRSEQRANLIGYTKERGEEKGMFKCTVCGWSSHWFKCSDFNGLLTSLGRYAPLIYYQSYPANPGVMNVIYGK